MSIVVKDDFPSSHTAVCRGSGVILGLQRLLDLIQPLNEWFNTIQGLMVKKRH